MRSTWRLSITDCDDSAQFLIASHCESVCDFPVGQGDPAGAQTKLLGFQDEPFAVITAGFFQVRSLFPDQSDIICNAAESSVVRKETFKGFRLIQYKLDVEPALLIAGTDLVLQS